MNQNKEEGEGHQILAKNFKNISNSVNQTIDTFTQLYQNIEEEKNYDQFVSDLEQFIYSFKTMVQDYQCYLEDQDCYLVKTKFITEDSKYQNEIVNDVLDRLQQIYQNLESVKQMAE